MLKQELSLGVFSASPGVKCLFSSLRGAKTGAYALQPAQWMGLFTIYYNTFTGKRERWKCCTRHSTSLWAGWALGCCKLSLLPQRERERAPRRVPSRVQQRECTLAGVTCSRARTQHIVCAKQITWKIQNKLDARRSKSTCKISMTHLFLFLKTQFCYRGSNATAKI